MPALLARDILRPLVHEPPPPLEQVGAPVRSLNLVLDHVRQRRIDDLPQVIGLFRRPVPERLAEPVRHRRDP